MKKSKFVNENDSDGTNAGEEQIESMEDGSSSLAIDSDHVRSEEEMDNIGDVESDGSHDGVELTTAANDDASVVNADGASGAGVGVKKVKIPGLYKPPTHDELQTLKETQNLFKSNLMRLQVLNSYT